MKPITLEPILHRNIERILIRYDANPSITNLVKTLPGVRWSQTHKAWHLPMDGGTQEAALCLLRAMFVVDDIPLQVYLAKRKKVQASQVVEKPSALSPVQISVYGKISSHNLEELEKMVLLLKGKAYSVSTINTYRSEMLQLLRVIGSKAVQDLTPEQLQRYLVYSMEKEGITENTANSRLNALKFYYEQVLGREKFFFEIPRPKKALQLPKVLGEVELEKLFNALSNKKHKAILFTAYSAGLRVSEVCNLKLADIDSGRMQIFIERAKGKKDRYVGLSPILLDILREYIRSCHPRPKIFLFESQQPGAPYLLRTAQQVFYNAKNRAGIKKDVGFHSLRHSFATHLLEKGVDIKFIKDLLGHFNIKTTERYLHVKNETLVSVVSPLDDLWKRGNLEI